MFSRFRGRKRQTETSAQDEDEAIIHLSVPDEVLYAEPKAAEPKDMSWLESLPLMDETPEVRTVSEAVVDESPREEIEPQPQTMPEAVPEAANPAAEGRPRFPYGWLVVVEGSATGRWFPLERGTSTIGPDADSTIHLHTRARGPLTLRFDEVRHGFVLEGASPMRVNGVERRGTVELRDGDTFTFGGESLRLVALCSQNFHWAKDIAAE